MKVLFFLISVSLLSAPSAEAKTIWHWEDRFNTDEREKLTTWIRLTVDAIENHIAPYSFNIHIFFHRKENASEPTPWAHTVRSNIQGIRFHVDPSYPLNDFLSDWTAPHELSHLIIPYVGNGHSWFAEGFASYMQYQIMQTMGVITAKEARKKYQENIAHANQRYTYPDLPFISAAIKLRKKRQYPTVYWGGAVYFLQIDRALKQKESSLAKILSFYATCCRINRIRFKFLISELDRLSDSNIFSNNYTQLQTVPGFPNHTDLY